MLLDDEQAAINELVAACRETADHYEDAAGQLDDAALGELFARLREARLGTVESLCRIVRASGELPRAAPADKEHFDQLVTRVKAVFSPDSRTPFLDARIEDERRLTQLADEALALGLAAESRDCVEALRAQTSDALARLEDVRRRASG